jgi:hypothetical protein
MAYGNSYESPTEFQTPHTIYHRTSYLNPFLPYEQKRAKAISVKDKSAIEPLWTQKTNLTMIEVLSFQCRNTKYSHNPKLSLQPVDICNLFTGSSNLTLSGSCSQEDSSLTLSRKIITTNRWDPCKESKGVTSASKLGKHQCGSSRLPREIR